ncbi:EF-Hand 1, calcium-binding site [Phytophthora cactorum]|nr:EF-Hand 1, calcium-binding site [Phytophthora cactorum]
MSNGAYDRRGSSIAADVDASIERVVDHFETATWRCAKLAFETTRVREHLAKHPVSMDLIQGVTSQSPVYKTLAEKLTVDSCSCDYDVQRNVVMTTNQQEAHKEAQEIDAPVDKKEKGPMITKYKFERVRQEAEEEGGQETLIKFTVVVAFGDDDANPRELLHFEMACEYAYPKKEEDDDDDENEKSAKKQQQNEEGAEEEKGDGKTFGEELRGFRFNNEVLAAMGEWMGADDEELDPVDVIGFFIALPVHEDEWLVDERVCEILFQGGMGADSDEEDFKDMVAGKRLRSLSSKETLRRPPSSTRDDSIDDLYENNAFGDEDRELEAATAQAESKTKRSAVEPRETKGAGTKSQGNKVQFDVWVARKDKYERMARALAQLDSAEQLVAVALAATDCQLKTGKTSACDCPGVCREPAHSPGAISPKMIAVLKPYEAVVGGSFDSTKAMLDLAGVLVRTGEGHSVSLEDGTSVRITTAAFRMAQTVLAQCSILESPEGVKLQRPCTCPIRSLGDLWVKWTTKNHTFSRVPLTEDEAKQFSAGTRQMMDQDKNEDGSRPKPQKGDTAKIAARRALTADQKKQNAFFLGLCKKYWLKAQLRVAEYLQKTLTAMADNAQSSGKSTADVEMAALNRLGVRRMLQWLEEDAEAVENAHQEEAREKAEEESWRTMPGPVRQAPPPPRFDFSLGSGLVRQKQPCRPPSSTAELMRNSGLKYVHAMSEGFQGRGGDLEKSKQLLVQQGHVLRDNFDQDNGDDDDDPDSKPFSKDRYLFERRNNPALRGKLEGDRRRREQSRESYAAWVAHKAMRDKAVKFLEHLPRPREGEEDEPIVDNNASYEDAFDEDSGRSGPATPATVRWEEVGKALKAVDRTLLDAWVRWSRGFRSAGRCRALWESFAPVSCDVHCASSPLRDVFLKLLHRPSGVNYRQAGVEFCMRRHKQALARGDAIDENDLEEAKLIARYGFVTGRELAVLVRGLGVVLQPEESQRLVEFFADPEEAQAASGAVRIKLEAFLAVVGDERRALCRGDTDQLLSSVCMWETVCHECGMLNAFQLVLGTEGSSHRRRAELPGHVCRREQYGGRFTCSPESDMIAVRRVAPRQCAFAQWDDTQAAPFLKKLELWSAVPREQHVLRELVTSGQPPSIPVLERDDDDDALDLTTMLRLRWKMPETGNGGAPAFYQLETAGAEGSATFRVSNYHEICRDPKDFSDNDGVPRGSFTVTGLSPNTKYAFRVRALNGFGAGGYAFSYFSSSYYMRRLRELEEVFREADADGNGRISRDEFMEEIERRKPKLVAFLQQTTAASATENGAASGAPLSVFDAIETDDNESISWDEFLRFFHGVLDLSDAASRSSREYVEIYRGAAPRFEVLGLHSGTTYQFRVQAVNAEGRASLHSEPVVVNTLLPTPAPPTVNPAAMEPAVQSGVLHLRWAVANARPSLSAAALRAPNGADDQVSRLLKERASIADVDGSGYLELPEFQTLLSELGVPPTPERLAAYLAAFDLDSDGKISFLNSLAEEDGTQVPGCSKADEMRLVCYRGSEAAATVSGLEPNTRYRFRLRLVGAHASSALSEALTIYTAPSAPTCVGRVDVGSDSALVRWHPGPGGAVRYAVDCKRIETLTPRASSLNDGPSEWRRVYEGREPLANLRELQPETVYRLRVFAINSDGIPSAQSTVSQLCTTSKEDAQRRARLAKRSAGAADYFTIECGPEEGDLVLGDTVLFCERLMRRSTDADRFSRPTSGLTQASVYSVTSSTGGAEAVGERTVAAKVVGISRHPRHGNVLALTVVWCTVQLYNSRRHEYQRRKKVPSIHTTSRELAGADGYSLATDLKISRPERNLYRFDTFRAEWEDEAARYPSTWDK